MRWAANYRSMVGYNTPSASFSYFSRFIPFSLEEKADRAYPSQRVTSSAVYCIEEMFFDRNKKALLRLIERM